MKWPYWNQYDFFIHKLHCMTLHYFVLHYSTLYYITVRTLHTLHDITLRQIIVLSKRKHPDKHTECLDLRRDERTHWANTMNVQTEAFDSAMAT